MSAVVSADKSLRNGTLPGHAPGCQRLPAFQASQMQHVCKEHPHEGGNVAARSLLPSLTTPPAALDIAAWADFATPAGLLHEDSIRSTATELE